MNAKETLELISKQWCSLSDLIKILQDIAELRVIYILCCK